MKEITLLVPAMINEESAKDCLFRHDSGLVSNETKDESYFIDRREVHSSLETFISIAALVVNSGLLGATIYELKKMLQSNNKDDVSIIIKYESQVIEINTDDKTKIEGLVNGLLEESSTRKNLDTTEENEANQEVQDDM